MRLVCARGAGHHFDVVPTVALTGDIAQCANVRLAVVVHLQHARDVLACTRMYWHATICLNNTIRIYQRRVRIGTAARAVDDDDQVLHSTVDWQRECAAACVHHSHVDTVAIVERRRLHCTFLVAQHCNSNLLIEQTLAHNNLHMSQKRPVKPRGQLVGVGHT